MSEAAKETAPKSSKLVTRRALRAIRLDAEGEGTLQVQLYRTLRSAIARGLFPTGSRLPSSRTMAQDLKVSRNTVTATLDELIADGWVEARRGSGVYVLPVKRTDQPDAPEAPEDAPLSRPFEIDPPGLDIFPLDAWRRIQARRWSEMPRMDLREGASAGYAALRRTIADHVWVAHGVSCTPDQIIVTQGARSGLDLVLRCLTQPGDDIWLETPGYFGFRAIVEGSGRRPVYVPVDDQGLDVAAGRELSPDARVAVVTPQAQMPTFTRMSEARRSALLAWASETGGWIFEDDYDAEFRLDNEHSPPLVSHPGAERVIYAHSFNKTLFPALRIGFLVIPPELAELFVSKRRHADGYPSVPDQMVLRDFIEAGWLDTHLRVCRDAYRQRKDVMYRTVQPMLAPWLRFEEHSYGLHIIAWLHESIAPGELIGRAKVEGIALTPMDAYHPEPVGDPRLVLGFAGFTPQQLLDAAERLSGILETCRSS